jgi:hypothetical protein
MLPRPLVLAASLGILLAGLSTARPPASKPQNRALILVGLPGDQEHEEAFTATTRQWRDWLTESLDFDPAQVLILFGRDGKKELAAKPVTGDEVRRTVADLKTNLRTEDRLWVFFLGHADHDGEHTRFHLPGRDLRADQLAELFADLPCREQVFWMTTSLSGRFLRPCSTRGRIVITATSVDEEDNETEFPEALAAVMKRSREQLDSNKDGQVSVLELYQHTVAEVKARFAADKRVPTEHAQLDDNGDGLSTAADGQLAARTFLPWKPTPAKK